MGAETIKKHMTDAEWQKIYEMSQDRSLYQNLISSLFPTIHGQYTLGYCGLVPCIFLDILGVYSWISWEYILGECGIFLDISCIGKGVSSFFACQENDNVVINPLNNDCPSH